VLGSKLTKSNAMTDELVPSKLHASINAHWTPFIMVNLISNAFAYMNRFFIVINNYIILTKINGIKIELIANKE
jgi:hypothetical protein